MPRKLSKRVKRSNNKSKKISKSKKMRGGHSSTYKRKSKKSVRGGGALYLGEAVLMSK